MVHQLRAPQAVFENSEGFGLPMLVFRGSEFALRDNGV